MVYERLKPTCFRKYLNLNVGKSYFLPTDMPTKFTISYLLCCYPIALSDAHTHTHITKAFFPRVEERLSRKLYTNQALTTILTGHGNIKAYLYRFKIIDSPTCPCGKGDQHIDHLIYDCELLKPQRDSLKCSVSKIDEWPTSKYKLISRHYKALKTFTNQIPYDSLG